MGCKECKNNKKLKTFSKLSRKGDTYKNLSRIPKKFNEIYNSIIKNL